jgi:hypothetical protein
MKKLKLALLFFVLANLATAQKAADIGAQINQHILMIQNDLGTFKKVEKVNTAQGYNYQYFKGKELQLVQIRSIESNVEKYVSWYFSNGKMIYSETQWIAPTGDLQFSEKYYLNNDKLIHWIKDGKEINSADPAFKEMDTKLVAYGKKLLQQASE